MRRRGQTREPWVLGLPVYLGTTGLRHSRDSLAHLLFPRHGRKRAFSDLRQTISILKSSIGPGRLQIESSGVALAEGEGLWVDVRVFRDLRARALAGDETETSLLRAAELVRGPFLSGFYLSDSPVFEQWQAGEAEALQREQSLVLARLLDARQERGDQPGAIELCGRLLALDPLDEAMQRRMMRLYASTGRRAAAIRQYGSYRRALQAELGQQPDPETDKLHDRIVAGDFSGGPSHHARHGPGDDPPAHLATESAAGDPAEPPESPVARLPSLRLAISEALRIQLQSPGWARVALDAEEAPARGDPLPAVSADRVRMILRATPPGCILLSAAAAKLARALLPGSSSLRALGPHRLDDLGPLTTLFQLTHPDLVAAVPAILGLDSVPNNLKTQPTRFIGRDAQLAAAVGLLRRDEVRLLTLTGMGGTGKTRLAAQVAARVARDYPHGVFLVDLAAVRDPAGVIAGIAAALGFDEGSGEAVASLADHLRYRLVLLVLDNFEQLLPQGSAIAAELVAVCPGLKLVVTSRMALNVRAEHEMRVDPLAVPEPAAAPEEIDRCESAALFADRATRAKPEFRITRENAATVARICRELDGLPLAIELAAGRLHDLDIGALADGMEGRLSLLTDGPRDLPDRQRALRSELDWSYELLTEGEQRLFRQLGVFAGGWDTESAAAVCVDGRGGGCAEGLPALVAKSLVQRWVSERGTSYRLLETVRAYALDRLDSCGERVAAVTRLASYTVELGERAEPFLFGSGVVAWLDRLDLHLDSIRFALGWMHDNGHCEAGSRLAAALGWFWFRRSRFAEGQRWLELCEATRAGPPLLRARIAYYLGWMEISAGNLFLGNPRSLSWFSRSLDRFREAGDARGIAVSLVLVGLESVDLPVPERARLCEEGVAEARTTGDPWTLSHCLKIGYTYLLRQDKDKAFKVAAAVEAIALARKAGDPYLVAEATHAMGDVYYFLGEHAAAETWFRESLRQARDSGYLWLVCDNLWQLAKGLVARNRVAEAKTPYQEGLRLAERIGDRGHYWWFLHGLAVVCRHEGSPKRFLRLAGAAAAAALQDASPSCPSGLAEELGLETAQAAAWWDEGKSMGTEAAIVDALGA